MKDYEIEYFIAISGNGTISVQAEDEDDAEAVFNSLSHGELINSADLDSVDDVTVESITEDLCTTHMLDDAKTTTP